MLLSLISLLSQVTETDQWAEIIKILGPALIGALTTWGGLALQKRYSKSEKKMEQTTQAYKIDSEIIIKQREFIIRENEELWKALREELEMCRVEREKLDGLLENMKKRLTKIESELTAWELGLKTPKGFRLIKLEDQSKIED